MTTLPLHLAPSVLMLFMAALAVVPLAFVWLDGRRRGDAGARLHRLRAEASLAGTLASRAAADQPAAATRVSVPGA
jgi:hypothetical protein